MMKNIITLTILFILISCGEKSIESTEELSKSKIEVIKDADLTSYAKLVNYYDEKDDYLELLPYSLKIMTNNDVGHLDFFNNYLKIKFNDTLDYNNFKKLDKEEQDFLVYILRKGHLKNSYDCGEVLDKLTK